MKNLIDSRDSSVDIFSRSNSKSGSEIVWPPADEVLSEQYLSSFALDYYFTQNKERLGSKSAPVLGDKRHVQNKIPLSQALFFRKDRKDRVYSFFESVLQSLRVPFKSVNNYNQPLVLLGSKRPLYSLIVVSDWAEYMSRPQKDRDRLEEYCRTYSVGIFGVANNLLDKTNYQFDDLEMHGGMKLEGFKFNAESNIWRVAKSEKIYTKFLNASTDWTVFQPKSDVWQPLIFSNSVNQDGSKGKQNCLIGVHNKGENDGVERVLLGNGLDYWLNTVAAMDIMDHLTHGQFRRSLQRYVQVDVDDIFVGSIGKFMTDKDVDAMVSSQEKIRSFLPGFSYVVGFSGGGYSRKDDLSPSDVKGMDRWLEVRHKFPWFNHLYSHLYTHKVSSKKIEDDYRLNIDFAKKHDIPLVKEYSVPPKHSGEYPVVEGLYKTWNATGVKASSTLEYPRIRPSWGKRGFVYKGIKVIPRSYCGMASGSERYADLQHFNKTSNPKEALIKYLTQGEFFHTILLTSVSVLVSHMTNFGFDRIAQFTFETGFKNVIDWTNLRLNAPQVPSIADIYFDIHPAEKTVPLWKSPCFEESHLLIKPPTLRCSSIPDFIIVGPPRTGATALESYLDGNAVMSSPKHLPGTDPPDINFFSGDKYGMGLEWYLNHFPVIPDDERSDVLLFEKSAKYFMSAAAPKRIHALNPKAKIIVVSGDPIRRAYSWYLYMKYQENPTAMEHDFYQVLTAPETASDGLKFLRDQCLLPGLYANNLARYLYYFDKDQIFIVDSDRLKTQPRKVLTAVQKFLNVKAISNYTKKLTFFKESGFYCMITGCVGRGLGPSTAPLDARSRQFLEKYYRNPNLDFATLLSITGEKQPMWLDKALQHTF